MLSLFQQMYFISNDYFPNIIWIIRLAYKFQINKKKETKKVNFWYSLQENLSNEYRFIPR